MSANEQFINICGDFTRFSDAEFEEHYSSVTSALKNPGHIIIDFRYKPWFDLWALIQLLLLLDEEKLKSRRRIIRLLSPEGVSYGPNEPLGTYENRKNRARARLRFLSDMEFLHRAVDIGAEIQLQLDPRQQSIEKTSPDEIKQIISEEIYGDLVTDCNRPIIPITHLKKLDLKGQRDQLFTKAGMIFGEFKAESIVQQAGLGDCLFSELALNAEHHGGGEGYIALRAGAGLRRAKRLFPDAYKARLKGRAFHPLRDWRTYYKQNPEEGYFELVVVDRGPGITKSILEDVNIPLDLQQSEESAELEHALIQHALLPETSRLTPQQRRQKGLTEFTGLAAVRYVLNHHEGVLLIRERKARHIFGASKLQAGEYFEQMPNKKGLPPSPFANIPGVSVTAVIPMNHVRYEPPGFQLPAKEFVDKAIDEADLEGIQIYRVLRSSKIGDKTAVDRKFGGIWKTITKDIEKLNTDINVVLIDIQAASVNKNDLWNGIVKVRRLCQERGLALVLCGVEQRLACRLEEYAELDRKKISDRRDWLLLGFGDDLKVYCFGSCGESIQHKTGILKEAVTVFHEGSRASADLHVLLKESNYCPSGYQLSSSSAFSSFRTRHQILRELLTKSYAKAIQEEITKTSAWMPDQNVRLNGGEEVGDYLDIHSVAQMKKIYPDIARLIRIIVSTYDFDFVLSVGAVSPVAAQSVIRSLTRQRDGNGERVGHYNYYDYFGFDHGENTNQVIRKGSKVLLLVDGVRKGEHGREVFEHVENCGASIVAVVAIFGLTEHEPPSRLFKAPLKCAVEVPIKVADKEVNTTLAESPYTYNLVDISHPSSLEGWETVLNKKQAYRQIEGHGLILRGHKTFYDQHFERIISLPYLLNSSTSLMVELVHYTVQLIQREQIDCIVYPEQSSISSLVNRLADLPELRKVATVMCRHAVWPDRASGYTLDIIGGEIIRGSRNVLILEDETYTGNSLKNLISLCLSYRHKKLEKLLVMTIIDSMMRSEREALTKLLERISPNEPEQLNFNKVQPKIKFITFMQLSLSSYWSPSSCPLCRKYKEFAREEARSFGFIEKGYARERLKDLQPNSIDQDFGARGHLHPLDHEMELKRQSQPEPVHISSIEGLEVFCEEAYVEGDLSWLVDRIAPVDEANFPAEVRLTIISILSRDTSMLLRVRVRQSLLENVSYLLKGLCLHGNDLGRLMEILCDWPLHYLNYIWHELWNAVFSEKVSTLTECYPGAQLLLASVADRPEHRLKASLLKYVDQKINDLMVESRSQSATAEKIYDEETARVTQLAMCLRRSAYRENEVFKGKGALLTEIALIVAYYAPGKPHHWTLWKGLNLLSGSTEATRSTECMYAVQLAGRLWSALASLVRLDQDATKQLANHRDYERLRSAVERLQDYYPHQGRLGERHVEVQRCAAEIKSVIYENNDDDGFRNTLLQFLSSYRLSVADALIPLRRWVEKDANAELIYSPIGLEETLPRLFVVLDRQTVEEVFEEITNNMIFAKNNWLDNQKGKIGLFTRFPVTITVIQEFDTIVLQIISPSTDEDYRRMKTGSGGSGLGLIKIALERLGHTYTSIHNPDNTVEQRITMRRMYR
jgi:orotate phosphoribosyltransferase